MKALFSERSIEPLSERLAIFIVKWEFYFTGDKIGSRVALYTLKLLLPIRQQVSKVPVSADVHTVCPFRIKGPPGPTEMSPTLANEIEEFWYRSLSKSTGPVVCTHGPD